ncbi:hypothetical protein [Hymenobacter koreensis]|uniref:Uncharacterized protein n=1 Tax=Hymenobacter koreensis TaxID=1084523 RepID=A0ABP8JLH8_9BACT
MGKKKKKHSKRHDSVSEDLFDATALSIKKYRKVTNQIARLSPTQKLVGGLTLLAAGYLYVRNHRGEDWRESPVVGLLPLAWRPLLLGEGPVPQEPEETQEAEVLAPAPAPRKHHKSAKPAKSSGKRAGSFGKTPAASPDDDER